AETAPSLYQSHPWVLAVRADGSSFGVLVDTTCRCEVSLGPGAAGDPPPEISFAIDPAAPPFAVYLIARDSPPQAVAALSDLTGRMPMPPRWALGYHQCRWSYQPASRVVKLAEEFRRRGIPCDGLWLDIDYMDGFRSFTFDPEKFGDPVRLNETFHA